MKFICAFNTEEMSYIDSFHLLLLLILIFISIIHIHLCAPVPQWCVYGGQKASLQSFFSLSTFLQVLGVKLNSQSCVAGVFSS